MVRIDVVVSNIVAEGLTPTNFEVVFIFGVNPIALSFVKKSTTPKSFPWSSRSGNLLDVNNLGVVSPLSLSPCSISSGSVSPKNLSWNVNSFGVVSPLNFSL